MVARVGGAAGRRAYNDIATANPLASLAPVPLAHAASGERPLLVTKQAHLRLRLRRAGLLAISY